MNDSMKNAVDALLAFASREFHAYWNATNDEQKEVFLEWFMSRPEDIQRLALQYPPGLSTTINGHAAYIVGYQEVENERPGFLMSHLNPGVDFIKALNARFFVCGDHFFPASEVEALLATTVKHYSNTDGGFDRRTVSMVDAVAWMTARKLVGPYADMSNAAQFDDGSVVYFAWDHGHPYSELTPDLSADDPIFEIWEPR